MFKDMRKYFWEALSHRQRAYGQLESALLGNFKGVSLAGLRV